MNHLTNKYKKNINYENHVNTLLFIFLIMVYLGVLGLCDCRNCYFEQLIVCNCPETDQ